MKIVLISPPIFDFYYTPARKEPLGLLYIKEALANRGFYNVDIYDALLSSKVKKVAWPQEFEYLNKYYMKDESLFSILATYKRFGDSFDKIISKINAEEYEIVAISAMFSAYWPDVEILCHRIKRECNVILAIGGWSVESEVEYILKNSSADVIVSGNGEDDFVDFVERYNECKNLNNSKPNNSIPFKNKFAILSSKKNIPEYFPKRNTAYYFKKKKISKMVLSRGCIHKCEFCRVHRKDNFSIRTMESIRSEIEYLHSIGTDIINFEDDNIFFEGERKEKLLNLLLEFHRKGISYTAMNGMTATNIFPVVERMIESGFIEFNLSLVSGTSEVSATLKRPFEINSIKKVARKIGGKVPTTVFLILGLPESSVANTIDDIMELLKLPVRIGASPLYTLPNTPMFKNIGIPNNRRFMRGTTLYKFGDGFGQEDVASLWKLIRIVNAVKFNNHSCKTVDENIEYYNRSVREKQWYIKYNGSWKREGFYFKTPLPFISLKDNKVELIRQTTFSCNH